MSNGEKFSTLDQDNDSFNSGHCAQLNSGGWWYWDCTYCLLTCHYGYLIWGSWPTSNYRLRYAAMKLKRIPS